MQREVERHYSDLAETAADALGNVALVQSYARIEIEVSALQGSGELAAAGADAGAVVVGGRRRAHARRHDADDAGDPAGRNLPQARRPGVGRPDRQLHEHRGAPDRAGSNRWSSFANRLFMDAPKLAEFFDVFDTVPAVRDRPGRGRSRPRARPGRVQGRLVFL